MRLVPLPRASPPRHAHHWLTCSRLCPLLAITTLVLSLVASIHCKQPFKFSVFSILAIDALVCADVMANFVHECTDN